MAITRALLKELRQDIDAALKSVGEKHNVVLSVGRATFDALNATFKLEVAAIGEEGQVMSKMATDFQAYAGLWGLQSDDLNKTFTDFGGETYKIVGGRPRASKNTIVVEKNGKQFVMPHGRVAALLHREKAPGPLPG